MTLPRRRFLGFAAAAALPVVPRMALAQSYPSRPVRIVVTFPPGGSNDFHARLIGQWLTERLGQPFVVENRPGGGGNVGTEAVVRSAPDGHTLVLLSVGIAINAAYHDKLGYDLVRDIAPVAAFYRSSYVMLVNNALPARTVPEFIAHAKANPGRINMGSNGVGATGHLAGEMFKMMTGVDMLHVPYRGEAPALTDLISGHLNVMFATMTASVEFVRSGQLRALAVTSTARAAVLPDVPIMGDFLPGYELSSWAGLGAPRNTPPEVIERLNAEINVGLARPDIKARYTDLGLHLLATSPAEFGRLIAADVEKWRTVVKFAGLKAN